MSDFSVARLIAEVIMPTEAFDRSALRVEARLKALQAAFERTATGSVSVDRGLVTVGRSGSAAATGVDRVTAAQQRAAATAKANADAEARLATVMKRTAASSTEARIAVLRAAAANERAAVMTGRGSAAYARMASAQASALASTRRLERIQGVASKMSSAGSKISRAITLPVLAAAAVSLKAAGDFQQATNVYVTAAGESEKNLGVVRSGIKKTAIETGTSIKNLTDAEYLLQKAGYRGADGIKVLDAAAKGAREENANLADVIQGETSIMASYHLGADRAVQVTNALKTGAGQAKAPMEDYVRALSTVIPVASQAGVALDQVLGAYSTLTQHGTSPAESTQELAFTIRNLQAPSNVAVSAMNQLGISSVNVSKNLGRRGLTGTLEYIESKLPKSGLVYLSTMKQMEAGTRDLRAMQSKMPPELAKLSSGFLSGSVSAKDYRKQIRDMGADGYAQGSQFLSLAAKVHGYNDSIRNGSPAQKTLAAELKAIYGGAVGLNTALQLGGQNLAGFKDRTDAVGKSLSSTSTVVEGWNSTSKLAAVRADQAKERLHVLAIDASTTLLPMFTKLVGKVDSAVHWFSNLSATDKKILGWSIGVVAALGPVLQVGGRLATVGRGIGTFTSGTATRLASFAGATEQQSARVGTAMRGMTSALAAAGIGVALGSLTRHSSGAAQAVSALTSTAAGAAVGFGAGGPVGAGIGAAVGLVSNLATAYLGAGHDASEAGKLAKEGLLEQNAAASTLLGTLQQVGGAYNDQYKQQLVSQLDKKGLLAAAGKVGIDPQAVVRAALGSGADIDKLMAGLTSGKFNDKQFHQLSTDFIAISRGAGSAEAAYERQQAALGRLQGAVTPMDQSLKGLRREFANTGLSIQSVVGTQADAANRSTAAGRRVTAILREHAAAIGLDAAAQLAHGKSSNVVASRVELQVNALHDNLTALGFNERQVRGLIATYTKLPRRVVTTLAKRGVVPADIQAILEKYNLIPKTKNTNVTASTGGATAAIRRVQSQLNSLHGRDIPININVSGKGVRGGMHGSIQFAFAQGGTVPGAGSGDIVPAKLEPGEEVTPKRQAIKHRALLKAIAADRVVGYAMGGTVTPATGGPYDKHLPPASASLAPVVPSSNVPVETIGGLGRITTGSVGGKTVWLYKGQRYASQRAALNAQDRDARKLGGGIVDTATLPGVKGIANLIKGQTAQAREAMRFLSRAVSDAFDLKGVQKQIASVKQQIADMKDYRGGIVSTLAGATDLTKAGSVTDLEATLAGGTSTNNAFAGEVNSLRQRAHGNKTLIGFVNQLAAQGQTATLQTLAGSSAGELAQITKDVGQYDQSLNLGGNAAVLSKYGTSIPDQVAREKRLEQRQAVLVDAIDRLIAHIAKSTGRPVVVQLASGEVIAHSVFHSHEFAGVLDELSHQLHYGHQGRGG